MKFSNFQNYNPIDLLIEERFYREIQKFKNDTKLKTLSLDVGLKPTRDFVKKTNLIIINKYPELKGWAK